MKGFKKYSEYKASGVEWLGDVPKEWEIKRLKYMTSINDETLAELTPSDYEILYVDIGNVDSAKGITKKEPMVFEEAPSRARRIVQNGDTIVSTVRTYLRAIAPIEIAEDNLIVSTGFAVVRPREINSNYLSYALRSPYFVETVVSRSVGVSYPAINASDLATIEIPLPNISEQQAIADFLDRRTGQIDDLIAKKERVIELLQEKRTALISHAITKGLDPDAKMKDSGVDWLGEVPEHWKIIQVKRLFKIVNGSTPKSSEPEYWDGDILWATPDDLGTLDSMEIAETARTITESGYQSCGTTLVSANSIILSTRAPIGHLALTTVQMCTNQGCRFLVPRSNVNSRFYYYQLLAGRQELKSYGQGSTFMELSKTKLGIVMLAFPPKSEQQAIADFLDRETSRIDVLIAKVTEAIEKLKEYRTALISAAVTGKIKVF